jgi:O-Antigen ligase
LTPPGLTRRRDVAARAARLAFAVLIVTSPLRWRFEVEHRPAPPVYSDYTDFLLFVSDIALLCVLGLWLASVVTRPRRVLLGPAFLRWPAAGLVAFAWLGVPFATDPSLAAYNALRLVLLAALALYVLNEIGSLQRLAAPLSLMIAIQAVVAISQTIGNASIGLHAIGERILDPRVAGVSIVTTTTGRRVLRGYGLTDHPNILGGLLAVGLLLVAATIANRAGAWASLHAVVFALGAGALVVTFSRSAWLGMAVGCVVALAMLAYQHRRAAAQRFAITLIGGLLVAAALAIPFRAALDSRAVGALNGIPTEVRSIDERGALASETNTIFVAHPLLGVGLGGLPLAMRTAAPHFAYPSQPAHTVLLVVAAEIGIFGAACYAMLLVAPWIMLAIRRAAWSIELAGVSAALAALSVIGLLDYYPWTYAAGRIWAWLLLGLWAVAFNNTRARLASA